MIKYPYPNMQQLNLDWILGRLKAIMKFLPSGGAVGQILRRTSTGAEWSDETAVSAAVTSVNGHTGDVVLDALDVGALPDTYHAPVSKVNNKTGAVVLTASDVGALPDTYTAPVTKVNNKTGAVVLDASDVGALPAGTQYVITTGATITIPLANNTFGVIVSSGTGSTGKDVIIFNTTGTGSVSNKRIVNDGGLSVTSGTNQLTVENSAGSNRYIMVLAWTK